MASHEESREVQTEIGTIGLSRRINNLHFKNACPAGSICLVTGRCCVKVRPGMNGGRKDWVEKAMFVGHTWH